jgi:hypothetical protein
MYNPIITAVSPNSRVNTAAVRFKEPLLDLAIDFGRVETSL